MIQTRSQPAIVDKTKRLKENIQKIIKKNPELKI